MADLELLALLTLQIRELEERHAREIAALPAPAPPAEIDMDAVLEAARAGVTAWMAANITQPADGVSPTLDMDAVLAAARDYVAANIRQPEDGKPGDNATPEQIRSAVALWHAANPAPAMVASKISTQQIVKAVTPYLKGAVPALVRAEAEAWLKANITPPEDGKDGKSAYELAVQEGFRGTLAEWLDSLKGKPGEIRYRGGGGGGSSNGGGGASEGTVTPVIAATALLAYKLITTDVAGLGIYADADDDTNVPAVIGLSLNAGTVLQVKTSGAIENPAWNWTPRAPLYLGLILAQCVYVFHFWVELVHLLEAAFGSQAALAQLLATEETRKTVQISLIASVAQIYLSLLADDARLGRGCVAGGIVGRRQHLGGFRHGSIVYLMN